MSKQQWPEYQPQIIESKWQQQWENEGIYRAFEGGDRPKYYCLDFFPYPSGEGLHVGHCRNYVPTDVISRFKRMQGFNVLHPMGWDAFGEPAEQYAISHGVHPRVTTDRNTANYRRQMRLIGASYDWSREIDSSDPRYYRWTQWFFLLLYQRGLAYRDVSYQWWCPTCMTTLSSHEVSNGVCWRGHSGVIRREIPAWYFRITAYAESLLEGLERIDWPEKIKAMQRNWIGRSEGCEVIFRTEVGEPIPVFTTRADTLFGVTFLVLAPEHPLVERLTTPDQKEAVRDYVRQAMSQSEVERMLEARPKTGVFTGGYAIHPLSGERVPIWVADYVLPGYGTGAVMGVPAHDARDFQFARTFGLPVRVVIVQPDEQPVIGHSLPEATTQPGVMVNSGEFDGLSTEEGARRVADTLRSKGLGEPKVIYRMRDWLISRQRYWGTPIPIIHCENCGEVPVPEENLPVKLPYMTDFTPDGNGRSPLGRVSEFYHTVCPTCGGPAHRETDTMGGFACSSWYFLRFTSPHYDEGPFEPEAMRYWLPVNLYVGGAEHAVLHLLYARFWTKVMYDAGLLPFDEPFARLMNQGQLMGPDGLRMSKSRGNVIIPDEMVAAYGADALRVYEMFMAPFEQDIAWSAEGINGARRFLNRVWSLYAGTYERSRQADRDDPALERARHRVIRRVSERIASFRLNTMISSLMEFVNFLGDRQRAGTFHTKSFRESLDTLMLLLAPAAPYLAEELWRQTGHIGSVHTQPWPVWDPDLARDETVQIPVQIDGRLREVIEVARDAGEEDLRQAALAQPKVQQHLAGRELARWIIVPGKVINLMTRKV